MFYSIIHTVKFHSIHVVSYFLFFGPCSFRLLHFILKLCYCYILVLENSEKREKVAKKELRKDKLPDQ